tara:strand:+ start:59 stop:484 length:426 start_codon:yes stop_codon:yes gene_type:complete
MIIITQQLADKLPKNNELLSNLALNPQDYLVIHPVLKEVQQLTIYDITTTQEHPLGTIINVNDHINRTGNNPLIGHQIELGIDFTNINKLYKSEQNSKKTDCCGKTLNLQYPYPSHYLCNISILAKAIGIPQISAFLVNIP